MVRMVYVVRDEKNMYLRKARVYPERTSDLSKAGIYSSAGYARTKQKKYQRLYPKSTFNVIECKIIEMKTLEL